MVTITAKHDLEHNMLCLETKGHAGYDKHGRDIVCASVSILTYTLAQVVKDMHDTGSINECAITPSPRVQKTVLYICIFFAVLHTGLWLPSF